LESDQPLLLGIDVGTSALKALVTDPEGRVVAVAGASYGLSRPQPGWSEQDPEDWWRACVRAVRSLRRKDVFRSVPPVAIGLTGQMHGSVFLDEADNVVRPAILWNDQRTAAQCDEIESKLGIDRIIALTANRPLTGFTAPKILWLRHNEPEHCRRVRHVLLPKDYLRLRLTGEHATDVSDASGTLLFDVRRRRWSQEMLTALQIDSAWLPPALESPDVSGRLTRQAGRALGLPAGIPVVAGAGDQAAGAVGSGAVETGIIDVSVGTSGVVFAPTQEPLSESDISLHCFCHASPGLWHVMGVMLSAGGSLQWLGALFRSVSPKRHHMEQWLTGLAEDVPTGSDGLLFLPYLTGERTPYADPLARGAFVGLTDRHSPAEMARAVMEGVAFGLRDSLGLVRRLGIVPAEVRIVGGGGRSALWREIIANVFGLPVTSLAADEGGAFGAALLAGVGASLFPDVRAACRAAVKTVDRIDPKPATVAFYDRLYDGYRALYPALRKSFNSLHDLSVYAWKSM
jgi:xylulokinase